jgi:hypothetical protein
MNASTMPAFIRLAGIVTTAQLLAAGTTRRQIRTLVSNGALIPAWRGAYACAPRGQHYLRSDAGQELTRLAAAAAVTGPGTVISHQSAARLYGIDLLGEPGTDVTLTCRPEHGWRSRTGTHVYANDLPADHVDDYLGLPVTTPARTVIALAC